MRLPIQILTHYGPPAVLKLARRPLCSRVLGDYASHKWLVAETTKFAPKKDPSALAVDALPQIFSDAQWWERMFRLLQRLTSHAIDDDGDLQRTNFRGGPRLRLHSHVSLLSHRSSGRCRNVRHHVAESLCRCSDRAVSVHNHSQQNQRNRVWR